MLIKTFVWSSFGVLIMQDDIPDLLTSLCNSMSVNGSVCQAVIFDNNTNGVLVAFKGQAPTTPIDFGQACWNVNSTMWILDSGERLLYVFKPAKQCLRKHK